MTRTTQDVGDELYALPPQAFTAARDTQVAQARIDGDKALASAVAAFKRPTVAAWLVNLVALSNPDALTALIELGDSIRQAQGNVTPVQLRDLSAARRKELDAILRRARSLATHLGEPEPSKAQLIEVESTFAAAMADEDSARLVRAGRLLKSLSYSGFGGGFSSAPSGSGAGAASSSSAFSGTASGAATSEEAVSGRAASATVASGAAEFGTGPSGSAASRAAASGSAASESAVSGSAAKGAAAKAEAQAKAHAEEAAALAARRAEAVNRLTQAQQAVAQATDVEANADQRVRQLTDEIARIRETLEAAQRDARSARQHRLAAERDATSAQRRLARLGP
jgi:hypothetical protein